MSAKRKVEHTPGPWVVKMRDGRQHRHNDIMSGQKRIASIGESTIGNLDESNANAALIAAAPDLLAALKAYASDDECVMTPDFDTRLEVRSGPTHVDCKFCNAQTAIARAEGRQE